MRRIYIYDKLRYPKKKKRKRRKCLAEVKSYFAHCMMIYVTRVFILHRGSKRQSLISVQIPFADAQIRSLLTAH